MSSPIYGPLVFLRCKKCGRKTDHVLINIIYTSQEGEIEETYECQECGETKKIYELASSELHSPVLHPVKKGLKKPEEKDYMEVTLKKKKHGIF